MSFEIHKVKIANHGLFAEHDMPCATCWIRPAVLEMQTGIFQPCWTCQSHGYTITKSSKWGMKVKEILRKL